MTYGFTCVRSDLVECTDKSSLCVYSKAPAFCILSFKAISLVVFGLKSNKHIHTHFHFYTLVGFYDLFNLPDSLRNSVCTFDLYNLSSTN